MVAVTPFPMFGDNRKKTRRSALAAAWLCSIAIQSASLTSLVENSCAYPDEFELNSFFASDDSKIYSSD